MRVGVGGAAGLMQQQAPRRRLNRLGTPKHAGWWPTSPGTLGTGLLGKPVRLHGKRPLEHA